MTSQRVINVSEHPSIHGLFLAPSALLPDELEALILNITDSQWFEDKNQAMNFGLLPAFLAPLVEIGRLLLPEHLRSRTPTFNQMIANKYQPGEGLKDHVDLHRFADGILVASLKGTCTFVFRPLPSSEFATFQPVDIYSKAGDVFLLTGSARWKWTHGIPGRNTDLVDGVEIERRERWSCTLRWMPREGEGENEVEDDESEEIVETNDQRTNGQAKELWGSDDSDLDG